MVGKIIGIIHWGIKAFEGATKTIKKMYRTYRSRKIRNAVDGGNTSAIDRIMRDIKRKRQDRNDAS